MVSLICANQASLPTWFQALDGNSSDSTSFAETIRAYLTQFTARKTSYLCFVADAALYNENQPSVNCLPTMSHWLTRVPATLNAVKAHV